MVAEDPDGGAIHVHIDVVDTPGGQLLGPLAGQLLTGLGDDLAGPGVRHRGGQHLAGQPAAQVHLLVEFIAAHAGQVVAPGVKNRFWSRVSSESTVGGSPGRSLR